jgi:2-oxoglutarate ferredoxin oxidoreductase subunit beta
VWIITGDGDGLSIGGNHMLHLLRRNLDVQVLLFNNEIYGLTKGQYSPTSRVGTRSPSTPYGSVDRPASPCAFALGAGARFVARTVDTAQKAMPEILKRAHAHKGTSFVEIFQNCLVYNDAVFDAFTDKKAAPMNQLHCEHGKPLLFAGGTKGLAFDDATMTVSVVDIDAGDTAVVMVHDETNRIMAQLLIDMPFGPFPMALGVIWCSPAPSFEVAVAEQNATASAGKAADLDALIRKGQSWEIAAKDFHAV